MKRKDRILEILKERKEITVKELSSIFKVSEMTIYRDIRELENEGKIKRKHGLVIYKEPEKKDKVVINRCPICFKPITRAHPYKIILENGDIVETCCEHCGFLMHERLRNEKVNAITYDFITENPITAFNAYYVFGSSAIPCCSPSVIPFANREDAEKFSKGFGGEVLDFKEVYNRLNNRVKFEL
jgi:DeoR/GlpR family transcriptional regulator of sugar metabolism